MELRNWQRWNDSKKLGHIAIVTGFQNKYNLKIYYQQRLNFPRNNPALPLFINFSYLSPILLKISQTYVFFQMLFIFI